MILIKLTLAANDKKVSKDSSNADAAVCEHEQASSDDEDIEFEWTKEALAFWWYEEPEDCDRLSPADDDMNTRNSELYSSFLRLEKLKKVMTTKNNEKISSDQKECSEKLRTLQGDTYSERGPDDLDLDVLDVRPRQEPKTNKSQVQESSDRRRKLQRHPPPLYCQRHCGQ